MPKRIEGVKETLKVGMRVELKKILLDGADHTLEELARRTKMETWEVFEAMQVLAAEGKNISVSQRGICIVKEFSPTAETIDVTRKSWKAQKFGLTADNHLGSKYERLDVLSALFDMWAESGVETVYQLGNIIEGEARFNKNDLMPGAQGVDGQVDYLLEHWPRRDGITTKFITGDDHEGWYIQREGINIGEYIQSRAEKAGRKDLIFLGHMEHNIELKAKNGRAYMRLIHAGGGSSYAISYTDQKYAESLQGGEKPNMVFVGHYHKFNHGYPREIHMVQAGCTQDQTPFMRKKKLQAMVGGCEVEFVQDDQGIIHKFKVAWIPFYDRGFYANSLWKYHWGKK